MTSQRLPLLLEDLERLVCCESPSSDVDALRRCAGELAGVVRDRLGETADVDDVDGKPVLRAGGADAPVLLLGHLDTVHPLGTLDEVPFGVNDGLATGPGIFDMKAGVVQAVHAMAEVVDPGQVALLVTSDEEIGSPASRAVIEKAAAGRRAVFVLEPSSNGRLKTARKGVSNYVVEVTGRAAHAGLEPERGANACLGLAHAAIAAANLAAPGAGTTVTPTVASAGTTANTVPAAATLAVDVRAPTAAEQERVDAQLHAVDSPIDDVELAIYGGINRLPLEAERSARLFDLAVRVAAELGLDTIEGEHVGGGSDGNLTAALGVETLDGLGAVGAGAHTHHEWVDVTALDQRTSLVARLATLVSAAST